MHIRRKMEKETESILLDDMSGSSCGG